MIAEKLKGYESWMVPEVPENIPHGCLVYTALMG